MPFFRKKPVVIEAFRWTGGPDQTEDPEWICEAMRAGTVRFENVGTPQVALLIDTLEGTHRASQGDWIIRGVKGEFYPCKPDIFAATYEPAGEAAPAQTPRPPPVDNDHVAPGCEPFSEETIAANRRAPSPGADTATKGER